MKTKHNVPAIVLTPGQSITTEAPVAKEERKLYYPLILGAVMFMLLCLCTQCFVQSQANKMYAQELKATEIAAWTDTPTITPTPSPTAPPTITPLPTLTATPPPTVVILPTLTAPPVTTPQQVVEKNEDFGTWYTKGLALPVNLNPDALPTLPPRPALKPLSDNALAPLSDSAVPTNTLYLTVTATPLPTATPQMHYTFHPYDTIAFPRPDRDGSTALWLYIEDEAGRNLANMRIKAFCGNAKNALYVNEPQSQKTIIDQHGNESYFFHVGGATILDCYFYTRTVEGQINVISSKIPIQVGKNQEVHMWWQPQWVPLDAAPVNTGAGVDNGRSPASASSPSSSAATSQPAPTAPPPTLTPTPRPTWTPHIVYIVVTSTPLRYATPTDTPTRPAPTPTNLVMPPTFTPPPHFNTPPPRSATPIPSATFAPTWTPTLNPLTDTPFAIATGTPLLNPLTP